MQARLLRYRLLFDIGEVARMKVAVECAQCGGEVHMTTCDEVRGTGHEWVLGSICHGCQAVHFTSGCPDCPTRGQEK